jgi:hypothetical protein
MKFAGATLTVTGTFTNNGVLDLLTSPGTILPPGFVNNGTVIDSSSLRISKVSTSGGQIYVEVQSRMGHVYTLQRASSPEPTAEWQDVGSPFNGSGGLLTFSQPAVSGMFYRVRILR